jgi:hypothetical protein
MATTIPTNAGANGFWSCATVWFSSSIWFHARSNSHLGFQWALSSIPPKPSVCSAIQSVGGTSIAAAGRQPAAASVIPEQH